MANEASIGVSGGGESSGSASGMRLLLVSVGNTNASASLSRGATLDKPRRIGLGEMGAAVDELAAMARELDDDDDADADRAAIVFGSVNHEARDALMQGVRRVSATRVYAIGEDLAIPLKHTLSEAAIAGTGQDRLLNAVAAYEAAKQAVVVVDAGTAITVDFIDGQGTFHGGAIAAGAGMCLRALHERTSALPEVSLTAPADAPFGIDTEQAMLQGVKYGAQGMVRRLVERYALHYEAYPLVVATGGDAGLLFDDDELVDRVVPHLTLRGIALSCVKALEEEE